MTPKSSLNPEAAPFIPSAPPPPPPQLFTLCWLSEGLLDYEICKYGREVEIETSLEKCRDALNAAVKLLEVIHKWTSEITWHPQGGVATMSQSIGPPALPKKVMGRFEIVPANTVMTLRAFGERQKRRAGFGEGLGMAGEWEGKMHDGRVNRLDELDVDTEDDVPGGAE